MFCAKCGSKIQDGSSFCGNCGTPLTKKNKSGRKIKAVFGIAALFIVFCIIIYCASIFIKKQNDAEKDTFIQNTSGDENIDLSTQETNTSSPPNKSLEESIIQFSDLTFKKYVLKQLGKRPNEEVTYDEAKSLEKLIIDRSYRTDVSPYNRNASVVFAMDGKLVIDLSDIRYFTELKELVIENYTEDTILGLENISYCKKLENLTMNYDSDSFWVSYGDNYIVNILKPLTNLKNFYNKKCFMSNELVSRIKETNNDINIVCGSSYFLSTANNVMHDPVNGYTADNEDYRVAPNSEILSDDTLYLQVESQEELVDKINIESDRMSSIRYIYILCRDSKIQYEIDASMLKAFANLETLCIADSNGNSTHIELENEEEIKNLKYLSTLILNGVNFNKNVLPDLINLDTLSLKVDGDIDLSNCQNIKKLAVYTDGYMILPDGVEHLSISTENIFNCSDLISLNILNKKINCEHYLSLSNMKNLKFLYLDCNEDDIDISDIQHLINLQFLSVKGNITDGIQYIATLPDLISINVDLFREEQIRLLSGVKYLKNLSAIKGINEISWKFGERSDEELLHLYSVIDDFKELLQNKVTIHYLNLYKDQTIYDGSILQKLYEIYNIHY